MMQDKATKDVHFMGTVYNLLWSQFQKEKGKMLLLRQCLSNPQQGSKSLDEMKLVQKYILKHVSLPLPS